MASWLCTQGSKKMLVKIVHPGGHVELHDRPLVAAEIMLRNPRCCVAYPHVFKQPWAIVPPDTMLRLGEKFYVVPIGTIRKLQKLSLRLSPSSSQEEDDQSASSAAAAGGVISGSCCLFPNYNSPKISYSTDLNLKRTGFCFTCLLTGSSDNDPSRSSASTSSISSAGSSETKELNRKRARDSTHARKGNTTNGRDSPKRRSSFDSWHPSLASILEE